MLSVADIRALLPSRPLREPAGLPFLKVASGKVREIYDLGDRLLIIASDRISAFDVILPGGVPGKGMILTQLSLWWFARSQSVMRNHLLADHDAALGALLEGHEALIPRAMLVRKLEPLKMEAVVRGYLAGSGWKEYCARGQLWGHPLPSGLTESAALPEPLFTPTSKAAAGHDEPLTETEAVALLGVERYEEVKQASLELYRLGSEMAERAGLILADTKFEFGLDASGQLYLIDEVLTPDSSRYWPRARYQPGRAQAAFDKQYVRDYLEKLNWDKTPPGPKLPAEVVRQTQSLYLEAFEQLSAID